VPFELCSSSIPTNPKCSLRPFCLFAQSDHGARTLATAHAAWGTLASLTHDAAARLCEGLRLILEPTLAAKLGGEFRSGKRLNMRRIIPYIASNFRKDKIWMRRSAPSKRVYQVLLAIDDSRSMAPGNLGGGGLACEAMALLCKALARLEAGDIGVVSFGDTLRILHPIDRPFTDEAGALALAGLTFAQDSTRTADALQGIIGLLDAAKATSTSVRNASAGAGTPVQCLQIVFLVSDGMLGGSGPERARIRNWVTEATAKGQLLVLLIVDRAGRGSDESIASMQSIRFEGGRVVRQAYLDDYPFPYYLVVRDVQQLPAILSDAMRQWFELIAAASAAARGGVSGTAT
jgi:midasin